MSVIIPAFNEEDGIIGTIESCLAVDYPEDLLEVIVINDGSTDRTWERILEAKRRWPKVFAIDLGRNYGKRGAMAEGIRRAGGEILTFVDSDSYLERDAVKAIVQPFVDDRVGAVVGHAYVRNADVNWITKMQQVRYYSAFRVIKGMESLLSGTVTCASGCCAAYRTSVILPLLEAWEFQTFLGRPATFGDDRALTNRVLARHRVVYQASARADTVVPTTLRKFFRQQLRWKKSWLRESLYVVRRFWRKNPLAALFTYASIAFPFMAPFVVLHALAGRVAPGQRVGGVVLPRRHLRHGAAVLAVLRLQAPGRRVAPRHDVRARLHVLPRLPDLLGDRHHARHPLGHPGLDRRPPPDRPVAGHGPGSCRRRPSAASGVRRLVGVAG